MASSTPSASSTPNNSSSKNPILLLAYLTIVALWIGAQTINIHYVINILTLVTAILYTSCHLSLTLREEQALARGETDPSAPNDDDKEKKKNDEDEKEETMGPPQYETLRLGEAMQFPLLGSASLFSLYMAFKYFDKETVNLIISFYFCLVGLFACTSTLGPIIEYNTTAFGGTKRYGKTFTMKHPLPNFIGGTSPWTYKLDCSTADILAFIASALFIARYFVTKHWTYNNILGICFCIQGIERFSLGTYKIGAILLIGLFFYDIFWVFGTDVMVTVAKSLDGPIKLLFPRSIVKDVVTGKIDMSLLGLGDIVLPGFFLSLLLRFDAHMADVPAFPTNVHATFAKPYFHSGLVGYIVGLATTLYVMIVWEAAQPALLYLVPSCLGSSLLCAVVRGELKELFAYTEEEEEVKDEEGDKDKKDVTSKKDD